MKTLQDFYPKPFGTPGNWKARIPFGERIRFRTGNTVREQAGFGTTGLLAMQLDGTVKIRIYKPDADEPLYEAEDLMNCNVAPAPLDGSNIDGQVWRLPGDIAVEVPGSQFVGPHWLENDTEYDFEVIREEGWKEGETRFIRVFDKGTRGNYPALDDSTAKDDYVVLVFGDQKYHCYPVN